MMNRIGLSLRMKKRHAFTKNQGIKQRNMSAHSWRHKRGLALPLKQGGERRKRISTHG